MQRGLGLVLSLILDYLNWTEVAIYMLLCLTDLRPYLTDAKLGLLLGRGPGRLKFLTDELDLGHFRKVHFTRFWNSVSLAKRLFAYPTWPLAPRKLEISRIWSRCGIKDSSESRVVQVTFNPVHKVVALVRRTLTGDEYFCTHWYADGGNSGQFVESSPLGYSISVSWSLEGSYLLCKVQRWQRSTVSIFRVCPREKKIVMIKGLELSANSYTVSSKLWLSDTKFIFPGYDESLRVSRPWIYEIKQDGRGLTVRQPLRRLRKEHPKSHKSLQRGCLMALSNGYSYQVSICQQTEGEKNDKDRAGDHCHSVLHFRDSNLNCHLSLSIPGFVVDATDLSESRVAVLYRESSRADFQPSVPTVAEDLPIRTRRPKKSPGPSLKRAARVSRVVKLGPFAYSINRFECVSDSSSTQDSDDDDDDDDDIIDDEHRDDAGSSGNRPRVSDCYAAYKRGLPYRDYLKIGLKRNINRTKRETKKTAGFKKIKTDVNCCFSTENRCRSRCKLFLCVFDLESKVLVMNEPLASGQMRVEQPYPELDYAKAFSVFDELAVTSSRQGLVLSTTENLLIIQVSLIFPLADPETCMTLHLANLKLGCCFARTSWKSLFMHPTKNVIVELPFSSSTEYPVVVGACTDLLVDEPCSLNVDLKSSAAGRINLKTVTYVVADEEGNEVDEQELRYRPAYGRVVF